MDAYDKSREEWLTRLYITAFPAVAGYVYRHGGTLDEAKDLFQEALVIYYEKEAGGTLQLTHSAKAYLLGIARHLWYRHRQKNKEYMHDDVQHYTQLPDEEAAMQPVTGRLLRYLEVAARSAWIFCRLFITIS